MKNQYAVILSLIMIIVVAVFSVINVAPVEVNYVFGSGQAPLVLVILVSVLLGGVLTGAVGAIKIFQLKRENKKLKSQLSQSSEENPTSADKSENQSFKITSNQSESDSHE